MAIDNYVHAKAFLSANPGAGKAKLAQHLGIKTPAARRLLHRYLGETQGHDTANAQYMTAKALLDAHSDWGASSLAQAMSIPLDRAKVIVARYRGAQAHSAAQGASAPQPPPATPGAHLQDSQGQSTRDMTYTGDRITTIDELLTYAEVDQRVWEVERHVVNKWEVGCKNPLGGDILTAPLWQVKAWMRKRTTEKRIEDVMQKMIVEFGKAAPVRPSKPLRSGARGIVEFSIMDLHLGGYGSAAETGAPYSIEHAVGSFWAALDDLLDRTKGLKPEKILLPIGNDFFNTDGASKTTTRGTPQDEDGRYQESFVAGRKLLVEAIDRLREIAPIHVPVISGNHDQQRVYYLGDALWCYFSRTADVLIDNTPTLRKYIAWEQTLIGYTHGDKEPHAQLPLLMATEQPDAWSQSKYREWHIGHWHTRRRKVFLPLEDQSGVTVRVIPSLCPPNAWATSMGYTGQRAASAIYFDAEHGPVAEFMHTA